MFGRIRASPSSLESLEGSPSKILKDDSFSIYETTLMKLKLGAQRDISPSSTEMDEEIINDSLANCSSASVATSPSSSQQIITSSPSKTDGIMVMDMDMDTDSSSMTTSPPSRDHVSDEKNSQHKRHDNVSILHFFKFKDPCVSSSCGEPSSTKNDSSGAISSTSIEYHSTSEIEMESIQSFQDFELSN